MTDIFDEIVMTSEGNMVSIHPTQVRALVAEGTVFQAAGRWQTELTGSELAERVKLDLGVCDFCSRPHPVWEFPCADFKQPAVPGVELGQLSLGAWGACEPCAALIRSGRWEQLADRAMKELIGKPDSAAEAALLRMFLRELHRRFAQHRKGPPARVGGG